LNDGWLDGYGKAISQKAIQTTCKIISSITIKDLPYPLMFPAYDGGAICEWFNKSIAINLEIDTGGNEITLSVYSFIDKQDFNKTEQIDNADDIVKYLIAHLNIFNKNH
jgi:hypothetical protein